MFDPMTDPVLILDREGRLLRANRAFYQTTGFDPQSTAGLPFTEITHPDGESGSCEICSDQLNTHPSGPNEVATGPACGQIQVWLHDIHDAKGERLGTMQLIRDLTVMSRPEAYAERETALLRHFVDAAYDAVYAASLGGKILWANNRATDLFGIARESLEGESYSNAIHAADLDRVRAAFELAAGGEAQRYDARFLLKDRETRRILVTNSPIYKGQGMGLAVTYGIVERYGGEIHVTSEPGQGSTFTIKLRRATDPETVPVRSDTGLAARSSSVLVVDDEAPIRVLLSDILRARGHKVMTAEDGLAGLRAVENIRFDMVITDLSMPGADGWTVIEETRRRWPDTKLVILTGYGGFAELAVPGGDTSVVDALISKPFNIAEIDLTINRLLQG